MLIVVMALLVGGFYLYMMRRAETKTNDVLKQGASIEDKQGKISATGTLVRRDNTYYVESNSKAPIAVDSNEMSLHAFEGEMVTVTGQYSGDTLFVGKIQVEE